MQNATQEQHIDTLLRELTNLKAELQKARGSYKRAIIREELRTVARALIRLQNP